MGKLQNTYDVKQDQFTAADMKHEYDKQFFFFSVFFFCVFNLVMIFACSVLVRVVYVCY